METKTKHPLIALAFSILVYIMIPPAVFTGLVVYFTFTGGIGDAANFRWFTDVEQFYAMDSTSQKTDLVLYTVLAFLGLYFFAHFLRLLAALKQFPLKRLLIHNMALGLFAGFAAAGFSAIMIETEAGHIIGLIAGVIAAVIVTALAFLIEKLLAKILAASSRRLYTKARYGMADKIVGLALRMRPESKELRRILGLSLFANKKYKASLQNLEVLQSEDTEDIEVLEAIDKCHRELDNKEKALEIENRLLQLEADRPETRLHAAEILNELDRPKEAMEMLRKIEQPGMEILIIRLQYELAADNGHNAIDTCRSIQDMDEGSQHQAIDAWEKALQKWPESEEAIEALGELCLKHRREEEGYKYFEKLVALDPHRDDLRKRLVQYYQKAEKMQKAEPHLTALMDAGSDNVEIALLYGDLLVQRQAYDDALLHFQYAVENYPEDYRFAYFLAQIHLRSGALEDAKHWAEQALKTVNDTDESGQMRIKRLIKKIEDSIAERELDLWRDRCNRQPQNIEMRFGYIAALVKNKHHDRAVGEASSLLEKHPNQRDRLIAEIEKIIPQSERNYRLMDFLAELKLQNEQFDEVFGLAKRMAKKSMNDEEVMTNFCNRILARNDHHAASLNYLLNQAEANADYQRVYDLGLRLIQADPTQEKHYRRKLFQAAVRLGYTENALEQAKVILKFEPKNAKFRLEIAEFMIDQKLYDEALEHIEYVQAMDFYEAEVLRLRDKIHSVQGKQKLEELKRKAEREPGDTKNRMELGDALAAGNQYREAIPHYQKAAQDKSLKNLALTKVAHSMAMIGMIDLAEETLEDATLLMDNEKHADEAKGLVYTIAHMLEEDEQYQRALKLYKEIFRVDAGFRDVVEKMEKLNV